MSDFEEKLNAILSNPESMGQIMNLAQSLNLGGGGEPSGEGGPAAPQPEAPPENASSGIPDGLSGLGSLLGQIDPKLIGRLLPLAGELAGGGNDERMQLLDGSVLVCNVPPQARRVLDAAGVGRLVTIR